MTLTEFLMARIAEDEAVARAAIDPDRPGTHWQWVTSETDTPVKTGDLAEAQNYQTVSLRTVEEYPVSYAKWTLPAFIIGHTEEVGPAGDLITRFDPARVLAECEAKRRIMQDLQRSQASLDSRSARNPPISAAIDGHIHAQRRVVGILASVYADHPDYQPEWTT